MITTSPSFSAPSATTTVCPTLSQPNNQDLVTTQYSTATLITTTVTITPLCAQSTTLIYRPMYTCSTPVIPTERSSSLGFSLEPSEKSPQTTNTNISVQALGALLGLSLVLLAVVILGWVFTCLIMKKRQTPAEQSYITNAVNSLKPLNQI